MALVHMSMTPCTSPQQTMCLHTCETARQPSMLASLSTDAHSGATVAGLGAKVTAGGGGAAGDGGGAMAPTCPELVLHEHSVEPFSRQRVG